MFLVTGGYNFKIHQNLDSTETFDPLVGSWTESRAKLFTQTNGWVASGKYH